MDFDNPFTDKIIDLPALGAERTVRGPVFYYGHPGYPMIALEFKSASNKIDLKSAHLFIADVLKRPTGDDMKVGVRWENEIAAIMPPENWSIERALHVAAKQDLAEAGKLLRQLLSRLKNGAPRTQRGTFQEFLALLQAMADLREAHIRVSIPPFGRKEGHPSEAPHFASRADPHTLRMVIRHAMLWFEPSRKTLYLGNRTVEWSATYLNIEPDRNASSHRRIEAGGLIAGFYERARTDLKLQPADIRKALAKFDLCQ